VDLSGWLRSERQRASRNHGVQLCRGSVPPGNPDPRQKRSGGFETASFLGLLNHLSSGWSLSECRAFSVVEERASASVSKPLDQLPRKSWTRKGKTAGQRAFSVSGDCLNSPMSSQPIEHRHPVLDLAVRLHARLESVAEVSMVSMTPQEKREALILLSRDSAQLDALRLRLLSEAELSEATADTGAATAADWLAIETQQVRRDARSELKLAQKLDHHDILAAAMAHGDVNVAQARAIVASLDQLPSRGEFAISPEQRVAAEVHLVKLAAHHDAKQLRHLGRHLFAVIAPELADQVEGKALEAEEARALQRTTLTMWEDDEGTCHGRFRVPALQGQMLEKMLLALTAPSRAVSQNSTGIDPDLPAPVRRGIAFTQILETVDAKDMPTSGGCGATVVVTMTLEQLLADLDAAGVCTLDTGGRISAAEARRLACSTGIIPMVLGGKSQPLDIGRKRRFHSEAMRVAMGVRDGGCTAEHCQTPPGLCHAHHDHPWSRGGKTNVATGRLLCPHHHRRLHDPGYLTTHLPDGKLRFHRRE
jgi:hypothetical protein